MYGYVIAIVVALILLAFCLAALGRAGPMPLDPGTAGGKSVGPESPAADEPTPDLSKTATPAEVAAARRQTPPA